jgi:hypothetical protein
VKPGRDFREVDYGFEAFELHGGIAVTRPGPVGLDTLTRFDYRGAHVAGGPCTRLRMFRRPARSDAPTTRPHGFPSGPAVQASWATICATDARAQVNIGVSRCV